MNEAAPIEQPLSVGQRASYWVITACVVLVLIISNKMWFFPVNNESHPNFGYTPGARLLYNSMLAALLGCIIFFYRHTLYVLFRYKILTLLVLVHFASLAVSIEPKETMAFSIRMLFFVTFFAVAATLIKEKDWLKMLILFFGISAVLNLLYIVAVPHLGSMGGIHSGKWRGLFSHKNIFSYFCAYGCVLFTLIAVHKGRLRYRTISALLALVYLVMIVKSHSSGALTCAASGVLAGGVFIYSNRVPVTVKMVLVSCLIFLIIAIAPVFNDVITYLLGLLGRDPTLTNRSFIWDLYLMEYMRSPILGLGANAYIFNDALQHRIMASLQMDQAVTPHNGYIAILVQLGIVGLGIYIAIVGRIILRGLFESFSGHGPFLHKVFVVFTIMHLVRGIVETSGSIKLSPYFAFIIIAYVLMMKRPLASKKPKISSLLEN